MSQGFKAPTVVLRFGKRSGGCDYYRLAYHRWNAWEFSDGCRGAGARTPWGAVIRWLRTHNLPVIPSE